MCFLLRPDWTRWKADAACDSFDGIRTDRCKLRCVCDYSLFPFCTRSASNSNLSVTFVTTSVVGSSLQTQPTTWWMTTDQARRSTLHEKVRHQRLGRDTFSCCGLFLFVAAPVEPDLRTHTSLPSCCRFSCS